MPSSVSFSLVLSCLCVTYSCALLNVRAPPDVALGSVFHYCPYCVDVSRLILPITAHFQGLGPSHGYFVLLGILAKLLPRVLRPSLLLDYAGRATHAMPVVTLALPADL